jgi:hypothetical protein
MATEKDTAMPDAKVDTDTAWVRARSMWQFGTIVALMVGIYMRLENRLGNLETGLVTAEHARGVERLALIASVDGVRDELRKVFVDSVATRQAQAWIELMRALNRAKYPDFQFADLPR